MAILEEARLASTGTVNLRPGDLFSRAMDREHEPVANGPSADKIDAFLEADFAGGDEHRPPPQPPPDSDRWKIALLVIAPVAALLLLFVLVQLSDDPDAPLPEVSGATELPTLTPDDGDDRILPVDATELEVLHRTLPPDGGLYSVVIEIRNGSDVAIPVSQLKIEVEAFGVRIDPHDVRYDDDLLPAGGSTEAAIRVELPADSSPAIVASYEGETIARVVIR